MEDQAMTSKLTTPGGFRYGLYALVAAAAIIAVAVAVRSDHPAPDAVTADTAAVPGTETTAVTTAPAGTEAPATTTSATTAPPTAPAITAPAEVPAEVADTVEALLRDAALAAESGNDELARSLQADAEALVAAAEAGQVRTTMTETEARALVDLDSDGPHFDPEGPWECEPPLIPREYITDDSWCYIFTDEPAGIADIVAVTPQVILVLGRMDATQQARQQAFEMVLADPSSVDEAMAQLDGGINNREIARFDPPLDMAATHIQATRDGADYILTVGDTTYHIESTKRPTG
ncbi:MAG: hypothetical protein ACE5GB_14295 [Acidimicrobiales bacterium]